MFRKTVKEFLKCVVKRFQTERWIFIMCYQKINLMTHTITLKRNGKMNYMMLMGNLITFSQ